MNIEILNREDLKKFNNLPNLTQEQRKYYFNIS